MATAYRQNEKTNEKQIAYRREKSARKGKQKPTAKK